MPRPKPLPEDAPVRITVSLPTKIVMMAEAYRHREVDELLPDFSALVGRALVAYAQKKHPELLQDTISHIHDSGVPPDLLSGAWLKKPAPLVELPGAPPPKRLKPLNQTIGGKSVEDKSKPPRGTKRTTDHGKEQTGT